MSLLKVDNIHVYYGAIHAIKGISFEVNEGEIVTLIGANGAGKSTTLNTIAGLLKPRSGAITFEGRNLLGMKAHKLVSQGMALCPEGRRIFQLMTVRENLEMGGYSRPPQEIEGSLEDVFSRFPRLKESCSCWTSRRWALPPFWWSRSSTSSRSCTRRAPPSFWWSRTRRWR